MSLFSIKKMHKNIIFIFLSLFTTAALWSLDLTDMQDSLSDKFGFSIGNNEGTTNFRSLLIPTGGRAESLGSAFTGLADDTSYIDYNPAASAILDKTEIALYHNSWIADSAMESLIATTRFNHLGLGAKINCFYIAHSPSSSFFFISLHVGYGQETRATCITTRKTYSLHGGEGNA